MNSLTGPGPEDTFRHLSQVREPEELERRECGVNVKAIPLQAAMGPFALTRYTQKTLLPIHERPVIDYAWAPSGVQAFRTSPSSPTASLVKRPARAPAVASASTT